MLREASRASCRASAREWSCFRSRSRSRLSRANVDGSSRRRLFGVLEESCIPWQILRADQQENKSSRVLPSTLRTSVAAASPFSKGKKIGPRDSREIAAIPLASRSASRASAKDAAPPSSVSRKFIVPPDIPSSSFAAGSSLSSPALPVFASCNFPKSIFAGKGRISWPCPTALSHSRGSPPPLPLPFRSPPASVTPRWVVLVSLLRSGNATVNVYGSSGNSGELLSSRTFN